MGEEKNSFLMKRKIKKQTRRGIVNTLTNREQVSKG
jgi:hypothetical protein